MLRMVGTCLCVPSLLADLCACRYVLSTSLSIYNKQLVGKNHGIFGKGAFPGGQRALSRACVLPWNAWLSTAPWLLGDAYAHTSVRTSLSAACVLSVLMSVTPCCGVRAGAAVGNRHTHFESALLYRMQCACSCLQLHCSCPACSLGSKLYWRSLCSSWAGWSAQQHP